MATGDSIEIGVAIPFVNWRAERYHGAASPVGWTAGGSPDFYHKLYYGEFLSSLSGILAIRYAMGAGDSVTLQSYTATMPVPDSADISPRAKMLFWVRSIVATMNLKATLTTLDSDLSTIDTATGNSSGGQDTNYERIDSYLDLNTDIFTAAAYRVDMKLERNAAAPCEFLIDSPFLAWRADTAAAGLYTMESSPVRVACYPTTTGSKTTTDYGRTYYADPYGGSVKWRMEMEFAHISDADMDYLRECYAVNRGASGYRKTGDQQLDPQPIAVVPHLLDDSAVTPHPQPAPPVIVGNMGNPDWSFRAHVGWGHTGSLIIEEA